MFTNSALSDPHLITGWNWFEEGPIIQMGTARFLNGHVLTLVYSDTTWLCADWEWLIVLCVFIYRNN